MAKKITSPAFTRKEKTTEQTLDELLNRGKKSSSRYLFGESADPVTLASTPQSALAYGNVQGSNTSATGYTPSTNSTYSIYDYPSQYSDFDQNTASDWLQQYMDTFGVYGDQNTANPYEAPAGVLGDNQVTQELADKIYQTTGSTYTTGESQLGYTQNDGTTISFDGRERYDQNGNVIENNPAYQKVGVGTNAAPNYLDQTWQDTVRQEEQTFYELEQQAKRIEQTDPERAARIRDQLKTAQDYFYNQYIPNLQQLEQKQPYFDQVNTALGQNKQLQGLYQEQYNVNNQLIDAKWNYDQRAAQNATKRYQELKQKDPNSLTLAEKLEIRSHEIVNDPKNYEAMKKLLGGKTAADDLLDYENRTNPELINLQNQIDASTQAQNDLLSNQARFAQEPAVVDKGAFTPKVQGQSVFDQNKATSSSTDQPQSLMQKASFAIEKAQPTGQNVDFGVSEALRGDIKGAADVLGSTITQGANKAKDILTGMNVFNPPTIQASELQSGSGLKQQIQQAQQYYQGGAKQSLTTPFAKKVVGESPSGTQELAKSSYSPSAQATAVSNPQDPFFKAGGATRYAGMINADSNYRGALTPALFTNAFYENAQNVRDVFGGSAYEQEAATKARQAEASKYNFNPDQWAYQNKEDYRREVDSYNQKLNAYLNQIESSAKGQGGDYATLARASSSLKTPFAQKEEIAGNAFYSPSRKNQTYADLAGTKSTFDAFKPVTTSNQTSFSSNRPDYANYVSLSDYLRQGKTAQQYYAETGQQSYLDQLGKAGITMDSQGNLSGVGIDSSPSGGQAGDVSWGRVSDSRTGQSIPTTRYTNPSSIVARARQDAAIAWNPNTQQKSISQRAREEAARKWRTY